MDWKFDDARNFERYSRDWDLLNDSSDATPLLQSPFVRLLLREFGSGHELIAVCNGPAGPRAMAVLSAMRPGFWQTFQPAQAPLGLWLRAPDTELDALVFSLIQALPGFALAMAITQQDPDLSARPALTGRIETLDYIQTARITINGSFQQYWDSRGKNLRHNMKRQKARLEQEQLAPELRIVATPGDVADAIREYGRLESSGWKAAGGTAIHESNAQGRFYTSLLEDYSARGAGRVYQYWIGGKITAADICIEAGGTLIILKTTYDESLKTVSPALLMRHEYFKNVFDEGKIKRIEFYGKLMEWHTRWSNEARTMYHANYYRWENVLRLKRALLRSEAGLESGASASPAASATADYVWTLAPVGEFDNYQEAWQAIRSTKHNQAPITEPGFVSLVLKYFADGSELLAVCGDPASPLAIAVLRRNGSFAWETFQPAQAPIGIWLHRADASLERLLSSLTAALPGFQLAVGVTQQDPKIDARPQNSPHLETLDYIRTAHIAVRGTFDEYWESRDRNVIRQMARRRRRLAERGIGTRLEIVSSPELVAEAIEQYGRIESAGWKGKEGTAVAAGNTQGAFYRHLLEHYCRRGDGRAYKYWFNDEIVAMELSVRLGDTSVFLKTTYDERHHRYSPGMLMRQEILRYLFAEGKIRTVEFYGPLRSWQTKWADEIRTMYHITYLRYPWLSGMRQIGRGMSALVRGQPAAANQGAVPGVAADAAPEIPAQGEAVTVHHAIDDLPEYFTQLFEQSAATSVFLSLPWFRNFIDNALDPRDRVNIYAADSNGKETGPAAILLMCEQNPSSRPWATRKLSGLSNYYSSLYGVVAGQQAEEMELGLRQIAAHLADARPQWDTIDLHPLDVNAPSFAALLASLRNAGMLAQPYFCFGNWYLQVGGRSYSDYFASLPSVLKNTLARKQKQLDRGRKTRFEIVTEGDAVEQAIRSYQQIYDASWKVPEPYPQFIPGLIRACAAAGWLRLGVLYIDEQPAAAQIWIVNGTALIYKLAYDEKFAKVSPGSLLTAHMMQHVIDVDKVQEIDYLTGDEAYKKDWMSHRRERWGIAAFNKRTLNGLLAAGRHLLGRKARHLLDT